MNKKLLSLLLALVMVFSFIPAFAAEEAPKAEDKKEVTEEKVEKAEEVASPAEAETTPEFIKFLTDNGYVKGDKKGDLMLDKNLTRAEFTALLARLDGKDDVAKAMQQLGGRFTDVTEAHWAKGYISYATGRGWVQGYPNGTFKPEANISYAEIATVLVRFLDVDTNGYNWPVDFIAKAFDLGLMKGLPEIKDYKQAAVRKDMFQMLYNTISQRDFGKFAKYDMIVLENSRTNALKDNTIKAEVLSVVQRPNNVDERGVAKIGDQKVFDLITKNAKDEEVVLGDSENLLGKVIRATVDGDKLVKVEVNKDYTYKYGNLTSATDKELAINGEVFSVRIDERYYRRDRLRYDNDDRMFRTYLTNDYRAKNYNYQRFAETFFERNGKPKAEAPNFVRATIKDGMVMFVDSFAMKDIAPVADVKRDGKDVYFYNDERNGSVDRMTPADRVIGYTFEKGFYNMSEKDIKKDDVIHMMDGVTLVRQDAPVNGKLEKTFISTRGEFVVIGDKEYNLNSVNGGARRPLRSVYAYDNNHFRTTQSRANVAGMIGGEVKALLAVDGKVQLITSDKKLTDTVGMVAKWNSNYPVFAAANAEKNYDLDVVRDTVLNINGRIHTGTQVENIFNRFDLVYTVASAAEEGKTPAADTIATIRTREDVFSHMRPAAFEKDYYRYLTVGKDTFRYDDDTRVFVVNDVEYDHHGKLASYSFDNAYFVKATMADVAKYNEKNKNLKAYVVNEEDFRKFVEGDLEINRYNLYGNRKDLAKIVVFTDYVGPKADLEKPELGRITKITNSSDLVTIEVSRGHEEEFKFADKKSKAIANSATLEESIVEFQRVKDAKEPTVKINAVLKATVAGPVEYARDYNKIRVNGQEFYTTRYTKSFGDPSFKYAYVYATLNDADVIVYSYYAPVNPDLTKDSELTYNQRAIIKKYIELVDEFEKMVKEVKPIEELTAKFTEIAKFTKDNIAVEENEAKITKNLDWINASKRLLKIVEDNKIEFPEVPEK